MYQLIALTLVVCVTGCDDSPLRTAPVSEPAQPPADEAPSLVPGAPSATPGGGSSPTQTSKACSPCTKQGECGGAANHCLVNTATGEKFCGVDCSSGQSCPSGFNCISIQTSTGTIHQCSPAKGTCSSSTTTSPGGSTSSGSGCGTVDEMRAYLLQKLNEIRAKRNLPAYKGDSCLDLVATDGNNEWAAGGPAHGHFMRECLYIVPKCECNWQQENMGMSGGSNRTWQTDIVMVLQNMMAEETYGGGHFLNIVSTKWTRVGTGILCTGSGSSVMVRLTNDFGP
jgi:hypothetical protein